MFWVLTAGLFIAAATGLAIMAHAVLSPQAPSTQQRAQAYVHVMGSRAKKLSTLVNAVESDLIPVIDQNTGTARLAQDAQRATKWLSANVGSFRYRLDPGDLGYAEAALYFGAEALIDGTQKAELAAKYPDRLAFVQVHAQLDDAIIEWDRGAPEVWQDAGIYDGSDPTMGFF